MADLTVRVAGLDLKNPVIAGSGEATASLEGILAAIDAGAAAVVAKSTNGSEGAKDQLRRAQYALLDERWSARAFDPARTGRTDVHGARATLFNRSGLVDVPFEGWLSTLAEADAHAREAGGYVIGSLIPSGEDDCPRMAKEMEAAGLRWIELNVGAPHAAEAAGGAVRAATDADAVAAVVEPVREAVTIPLTVKLAGEGDVLGSARAAVRAGADAVCLVGRLLGFVPDLATRRPVLGTFGAVGGPWALPITMRWLAKARAMLGPDVPLVGTNGARDGFDVARLLLAGATAVQMTSAVLVEGPEALTRAIRELEGYLDQQGLVGAAELVGEAADHTRTYQEAAP